MQQNQIKKVFTKQQILEINNELINKQIGKIAQQFKKLSIIVSKSKFQVQVPVRWTLNQVKCMLLQLIPVLDFNKFELQYNLIGDKQKLFAKTLVKSLKYFQLTVVQIVLEKQYQNLYAQKVKKVLNKYNLTTKSTIYPILHPNFSKALINQAPKQRSKNFEQRQPQRPQIQLQQEGVRLINVIRFFGLIVLSNLLFSLASMYQIGVLIGVALIYLLMENYVNQNQRRRRRQRQRNIRQVQRLREKVREIQQRRQQLIAQFNMRKQKNPQQIKQKENKNTLQQLQKLQKKQIKNSLQQRFTLPQFLKSQIQRRNTQHQQLINLKEDRIKRPIKAKLILWTAYLLELLYCYVLSVFPNWTVQTHLHANEAKMNQVMNQAKQLDSQASQAIKNWKIKKPVNFIYQQIQLKQ